MSFYYILTFPCFLHLRKGRVELFIFYMGAHLRDVGHLKEHLSLKEKLSF